MFYNEDAIAETPIIDEESYRELNELEVNTENQFEQSQQRVEEEDQVEELPEEPKGDGADPNLLNKADVETFFNRLGVETEDQEVLMENGFDNFESLSYLSQEILSQIGITNEKTCLTLLESLASIAEAYQGSSSMKEALEKFDKKIPGKQMTPQLLMKCSTKYKQRKYQKGQSQEEFLQSVNHISLQEKDVAKMENIELCPNLKVLQIYDNKISVIESLTNCRNLTQISLYNNLISKIEGLESCPFITKLYLEKNCISRLEGLTSQSMLEELILSDQKLSSETEFTFEDNSLAVISGSLTELDLRGCHIRESKQLFFLERIQNLNLGRNKIIDLDEVSPFLSTMRWLNKFTLTGNPITKERKYRDHIVMLSEPLSELDGKKVTPQEKQYLRQLYLRKHGGVKDPKKTLPKKKAMKLGIEGHTKSIHHGQIEYEESKEKIVKYFDDEGKEVGYQVVKEAPKMAYQGSGLNRGSEITSGTAHANTKHVPKASVYQRGLH